MLLLPAAIPYFFLPSPLSTAAPLQRWPLSLSAPASNDSSSNIMNSSLAAAPAAAASTTPSAPTTTTLSGAERSTPPTSRPSPFLRTKRRRKRPLVALPLPERLRRPPSEAALLLGAEVEASPTSITILLPRCSLPSQVSEGFTVSLPPPVSSQGFVLSAPVERYTAS